MLALALPRRQPVIKLVYCLRKRVDVPAEEFHRYWLQSHGPLVRGFADAIGAKKYIQSHTVLPALNQAFLESRDLAPAYDGITEVWWDDATRNINTSLGVSSVKPKKVFDCFMPSPRA